MRSLLPTLLLSLVLLLIGQCALNAAPPATLSTELAVMNAEVGWPAATNVARPWTRWWWLGSAVDRDNLTRLLETYDAAGLGGVEITCIYGIEGAEYRELTYLSEPWRDAVRHALHEAKRLGMGVDLPTGSGWRTGGPTVTDADANAAVVIEHQSLGDDRQVERTFDRPLPQALVAYADAGDMVDLTDRIGENGRITWQAPAGTWTLYTVTQQWSRDNVKRPAPGGEGKNINPLSRRAVTNFLEHFATELGDLPADGIRAQFHDSYEYEGNWCDDFFTQFEKRRGYKLQHHLPALDGQGDPDEVARVKCDYRETVSDLVLEKFIEPWTAWSHEHGMLSRNQSHGSPANWLDLYAACDIPETESFGRLEGGDTKRLVFMFASSAAHVAGKPLVSAETATWLDEHFQVTLGQVKEIVDRLMLAGVNHIVYHGTAYSPEDAAWPGWLFYASTQLNPQNPIWRDFAALNQYVTRCQSVLQSTSPDNDVLLYWPIHDTWHNARGLRQDIRIHNTGQWLENDFGRTAEWLDDHGHTFDYISDRQLAECHFTDGRIETSGKAKYAIVLVPGIERMPLPTGRKIVQLAEAGATIVSYGKGPSGTPGLRHREEQAEFDALAARFVDRMQPADGYRWAPLGAGRIVIAEDLRATLSALGVRCESWSSEYRLRFHRRAWSGGHVYLVKNESDEAFDGWVAPAVEWKAAALMDPLDGQVGMTAAGDAESQHEKSLRLQLAPRQSVLIKTYREPADGPEWSYREPTGAAVPMDGAWSIEFVAGGPELPPPLSTHRLSSWTELAGSEGERFAGTARYATTFVPEVQAKRYLLDLGQVADSARVELNGQPLATLFAPPYHVVIDGLAPQENRLVVEVTNVAANRIRDLDRRGVQWRIFKDINLVNINYRPFDASGWPVRAAGLLGPVTLTPLAD